MEQFYKDKDDYREGLIDIYNALACYSLQHSQDNESNISLDDAAAYVNRANGVGGRNDFALVLNGFVEIARGSVVRHVTIMIRYRKLRPCRAAVQECYVPCDAFSR